MQIALELRDSAFGLDGTHLASPMRTGSRVLELLRAAAGGAKSAVASWIGALTGRSEQPSDER